MGQYYFSVLPLLALALAPPGTVEGIPGPGLWRPLLHATAGWTLWQWPTLMAAADAEVSCWIGGGYVVTDGHCPSI